MICRPLLLYAVCMRYRELKIKVRRECLDLLLAELAGAGFSSVQIDDPRDFLEIEEHPEWYKYDYINEELAAERDRDPVVTLWFADDEEGAGGCRRASDAAELFGRENAGSGVEISVNDTGDDSEWLYRWQEHFRPTRIGSRIVVKPSWEDYEPAAEDLVMEMDPGMAFGSGLHETTSMCIKALEKYMEPGARVLDVGTGTGILAIAAALLGADDCLGIDIDDEAVRVASENTAKNGLGDTIAIAKGDLTEGVSYEADIIVANLMADLVIRLSPAAAGHLRTGGVFISSGILDIKKETVAEAVRRAGFDILEIMSDGEWRAVVACRS